MKANQGLDKLTDYKHPPAPFKGGSSGGHYVRRI